MVAAEPALQFTARKMAQVNGLLLFKVERPELKGACCLWWVGAGKIIVKIHSPVKKSTRGGSDLQPGSNEMVPRAS